MRARDFLKEGGFNYGRATLKRGEAPRNFKDSTVGTIRNNGYYDLYRATLAMAGHPDNEHDVDPASWTGADGFVLTYTPEEHEMAKAAFKKIGLEFEDDAPGPSHESDAINSESPVKPFKGYKR